MPRSGLDTPLAARMAPSAQSPAPARGMALASPSALDAFLLGLLAVAGTSRAQVPKGVITEVRIEGNESIATERIIDLLKSRVGRELDDHAIEDDLQALAKKGWFYADEIKVFHKADPARNGYVLIFTVREMPVLHEVEFRGMTKLKRKDIESNTGIKVGARSEQTKNLLAVQSIERLYREKGYDYVKVWLLEGGKPNSKKAIFEIFEGPKCVVRSVGFEGNKFASAGTLETKISSKPKLLGAIPAKFSREELEADARKLQEYYDGLGFFEAKVNSVTRPGPEPGQIDVTFVIWEGVQYKVRNIIFEGNEQIATPKLMEGMKLQKGQPYSPRSARSTRRR